MGLWIFIWMSGGSRIRRDPTSLLRNKTAMSQIFLSVCSCVCESPYCAACCLNDCVHYHYNVILYYYFLVIIRAGYLTSIVFEDGPKCVNATKYWKNCKTTWVKAQILFDSILFLNIYYKILFYYTYTAFYCGTVFLNINALEIRLISDVWKSVFILTIEMCWRKHFCIGTNLKK